VGGVEGRGWLTHRGADIEHLTGAAQNGHDVGLLASGFDPDELIASRSDALLVLGGILGFFGGGFGLTLLGGLFGLTALVVLGFLLAASGIVAINVLTWRVSRRLHPGRIGPLSRWLLETSLSGQWIRPSVLRRAAGLAGRT
jgi:hypothetical protein